MLHTNWSLYKPLLSTSKFFVPRQRFSFRFTTTASRAVHTHSMQTAPPLASTEGRPVQVEGRPVEVVEGRSAVQAKPSEDRKDDDLSQYFSSSMSLWQEKSKIPVKDYPTYNQDSDTDVAVIGGGLFGLLTAAMIKRKTSHKVTVLEARKIGYGVTGHSTAKVSALHQLIYGPIRRMHGKETTRQFAELNLKGLEMIDGLISELRIDCDWMRKPSVTYAETEDFLPQLQEEFEACQEAGLPVVWKKGDIGLPFEVLGAIQLDNQGQMDPIAFCRAIAEDLNQTPGFHVYENSRVLDVNEGFGKGHIHSVHLENNAKLRARYVVVATHLPILDRSGHFATISPMRSYCCAYSLKKTKERFGMKEKSRKMPDIMCISAESPYTRSIRTAYNESVLIVGGEGHPQGEDDHHDTRKRYKILTDWTEQHWEIDQKLNLWSAHDFTPADELPYIGYLHPGTSSVFTATGFSKWGFSKSGGGAVLICDLMNDKKNDYYDAVKATRIDIKSIPKAVQDQAYVAKNWIGGRVKDLIGHITRSGPSADNLKPGEGGLVNHKGQTVGAYRDLQGSLHFVSDTCSHLGCKIAWNEAERSWDCPCHGSRFTYDGNIIAGPACTPLKKYDW